MNDAVFMGVPTSKPQYDEATDTVTLQAAITTFAAGPGYICLLISRDGGDTWEYHFTEIPNGVTYR
jgi:hypothetical protein